MHISKRLGTATAVFAALMCTAYSFRSTMMLRSDVSHVAAGASRLCVGARRRYICNSVETRFQRASLRMSGKMNSRGNSEDDDDEKEKERREIEQNRESLSQLPFYRSDNGSRESEFSGITRAGGVRSEDSTNIYVNMLETLTPGEMVGQFMSTAPPRVQAAVKNTVIGLLGSLRGSPAFDASVVTTQRALASLMFQLEMTGYMFRNAEYRLALQKSLLEASPPELPTPTSRPALKGTITVTLPDGTDVQVDANAYVAELSKEVEALRGEIVSLRSQRDQDKLQDLLAYIQNLEAKDMSSLSSNISSEVLDAMRQLVDTVIRGMGGDTGFAGLDILTEVPAGTLAQLCMWQLVVGYNLREMEAREELNKQLGPADDAN